jgi:aspartate/methionine/tyrosine aminotransferase
LKPIQLSDSESYFRTVDRLLDSTTAVDCLFLVIPNNPTGQTLNQQEFARILNRCEERKIILLIDACFRAFDIHRSYDQYELLFNSSVEYIIIEDTGKIWPTLDLKLSFMSASQSLRADLTDVYDDFLLNVSPFISILVSEYAKFEQFNMFAGLLEIVEQNRSYLRESIDSHKLPLRLPFSTSNLSVEFLTFTDHVLDAKGFCQFCLDNGLGILSASSFFWSNHPLGDSSVRIALARPAKYFQDAIDRFVELLALFQEKKK